MTDSPDSLYDKKCDQLLAESEIRFAGIVDKAGKLIAGGFKQGITPHEGDETRLQSFWSLSHKQLLEQNMMRVWDQLIILQQDAIKLF